MHARPDIRHSALDIFQAPKVSLDISSAGPLNALKRLKVIVDDIGGVEWSKKARVAAVLANCPKSQNSMNSGVKHWCKYIEIVSGAEAKAFPVHMEDLLGWSMTFRCLGTFSNYLSYIRSACCALGHEPPAVGHPAVKRAMGGIAKRMLFSARCVCTILLHTSHMCGHFGRPRLAIQRTMLKAMIAHDGVPSHTALWLIAYIWLLRLPSEALPMVVCASEPQRGVHKAAVWREGDNICVLLSCRKNLQGGSGVLRRTCSCAGSPLMCPVHILWDKFLANVPVDTKPWLNVSAAQVMKWIRGAFLALTVCVWNGRQIYGVVFCKQVPNASAYGTHSLRRGHARDLLESGATLAEILRAGQWRSAAFMRYLNLADIEKVA